MPTPIAPKPLIVPKWSAQRGEFEQARLDKEMSMHAVNRKPGIWLRVVSLVAIGFGLLTIKEGGMTLSGDAEALAAAGAYVPFVLWFNFLAGFAYVAAGVGLWMQRRWAAQLAVAVAVATALVFIAFGVHVASGGAYAPRTVIAMSLRLLVWAAIAAFAWRRLSRHRR